VVNGVRQATYSTWMQWWARDTPANVAPLGVKVSAGDEILCSIELDNVFSATFTLRNVSTGAEAVKASVSSPVAVPPYGAIPTPIRVSGATAEWITERPTDPTTNVKYRLPDYGLVLFTDCHAVSAASPKGSPRRDRDLSGNTLITMYERRVNPSRTVKVSVPGRIDDRHTETRYREVP
jgi:hypothetical protein